MPRVVCDYPPKLHALKALSKEASNSVFNHCSKLRTRHLTLLFKESSEGKKISVILPKKKVKLAVDRNQIRRQVKEFFRQSQTEFSDYHMVILLNKTKSHPSKEEIKQCLDQLLDGLKNL